MKRTIVKCAGGTIALLALLNIGAMNLQADQQISAQFNMPIHITTLVNESGCDNSPGPYITLEGEIALGGLQVELILANNVKGTHMTDVTFDTKVVLVPLGDSIVIPKQPVLGGVGGNPYIWIQFYNAQGNLSDEIFLGRCVQGLKVEKDCLNKALAGLVVAGSDCNNNPGPYITFEGGMALSGVNARFIFRNNLKGTHTKIVESTANVTIIPEGTPIVIPKQPVLGGSGGNPLIWIQLLQGNGAPIGDPYFLGRCVQL
ncbi:MAG TPA: hypothetical protein VL361_08845 [Candidatus Limnocylindrales bacterium]|nr:hypothetical protein [Candidatus Limnocylindrales bacterium]